MLSTSSKCCVSRDFVDTFNVYVLITDLLCQYTIDIADMLQTISRDQTFPRRQVIRKITAVCLSQVTPSIIIERHIVDDTCKMLLSKAEVLFCP